MKQLLIVCGPTATGKTNLAVYLAKKYNGELVSADSRQVYRGMDIGTGKDLSGDRNPLSNITGTFGKSTYILSSYALGGVPIWMYDVIRPDEEFSVAHYSALATNAIRHIHSKGKLPIVVGGSGLYIKAITEGIGTINVPKDISLRRKLDRLSAEELQIELLKLSPDQYEKLNDSDKKNPRRLIRKIEIISSESPKVRISSKDQYDTYIIGLYASKEIVKARIRSRVAERVKLGIVDEIKSLLDKGYTWDFPSLNTLGYKEWKLFLKNPNEATKSEAISEWVRNEVNYAGKQMTWFKKQQGIEWFNVDESDLTDKVAARVAAWYTQENAEGRNFS